jgi:hypothetical protein
MRRGWDERGRPEARRELSSGRSAAPIASRRFCVLALRWKACRRPIRSSYASTSPPGWAPRRTAIRSRPAIDSTTARDAKVVNRGRRTSSPAIPAGREKTQQVLASRAYSCVSTHTGTSYLRPNRGRGLLAPIARFRPESKRRSASAGRLLAQHRLRPDVVPGGRQPLAVSSLQKHELRDHRRRKPLTPASGSQQELLQAASRLRRGAPETRQPVQDMRILRGEGAHRTGRVEGKQQANCLSRQIRRGPLGLGWGRRRGALGLVSKNQSIHRATHRPTRSPLLSAYPRPSKRGASTIATEG